MTQKTYKVVVIPHGDNYIQQEMLYQCNHNEIHIASCHHGRIPTWTTQQLLVLSDDIPVEGKGKWYNPTDPKEGVHNCISERACRQLGCSSVVASYPAIEGVPQLTVEDTQKWINAGWPLEIVLEMEEYDCISGPYGTDCQYRPKLSNTGNVICIWPVEEVVQQDTIEDKAIAHKEQLQGNDAEKWIAYSSWMTGYQQALKDMGKQTS